MRKYLTWRCIGLHVLVLVLVPAFLSAAWWQCQVAEGGNDLGWVYTVEWPLFAVYAIYMWWKLIHDDRTPFDRLWARKQRAHAEASATPLHQIPGWAMDKDLSRAVVEASTTAASIPALSHRQTGVLESREQKTADRAESADLSDDVGSVIEGRVVGVSAVVDEELDAYNRYLADLAWSDPPKRWGSPRRSR